MGIKQDILPDLPKRLSGLGEVAANLWWIEGFNGKKGWAFGQKEMSGNRDQADAEAIYELLEKEIIPLYYTVSDNGIRMAGSRS